MATMKVSVKNILGGDVVYEAPSYDVAACAQMLAADVAKELKHPIWAVKLVLPSDSSVPVSPEVELGKLLGEGEEALDLQVLTSGTMVNACATHQQLLAAIRAKTPGIPVAKVNPKFLTPIRNEEIQAALDLMKTQINPADGVLPDEVATWVELLLRDPDGEVLSDSGIRITSAQFSSIIDGQGTGVTDGLLYLSVGLFNGCWAVFVLDVRGDLAQKVDQGAAGAVWYAELDEDAMRFGLDVGSWDHIRAQNAEVTPLERVAPSLTAFFQGWATSGDPRQRQREPEAQAPA